VGGQDAGVDAAFRGGVVTRGELVHPTHPTRGVVPVRGGVIATPPTREVAARGGVVRRVWRWLGPPTPASYLGGSEYPVIVRRLHWLVLARALGMMAFGIPVSIGLGWVLAVIAPGVWQVQAVSALIALAHQGYFGYLALWWRAEMIVVTNLRLIRVTGVFTHRAVDTAIGMITDRDCVQTIPGRIFGYGTLRVESPGSSPTAIRFLPNPLQIIQATLPVARQLR
jgi:hypothetical protein